MSQNHEPLPKFCELQSLPTELLLEILGQALAPEHFDTILIQQTPRRRQRLHGPREAFMITERERFTLRQVSKHFKELIDAHPSLSSSKSSVYPQIYILAQLPPEWSPWTKLTGPNQSYLPCSLSLA